MMQGSSTSRDRKDPGAGRRPAIELTGLTKVYGRGGEAFVAVDAVTLEVPKGQVIGLLGPNGAGKTTTIKMMAGLIEATSGTAELNGFDVARQRAGAVRQIGAVLEGSRNVYWSMSAWENLLYFGRLKGLRGSEIKPRARWLLTELGLWDRRNRTVGTFSRGMQQKVAVAVALITDPPIILLDEPTLGLDVEAARTVKDWIARLAQGEGKTVVLTTHQLAVAQELSDRIAVIKSGKIIADLPTCELLASYAEDQFQVEVAGRFDAVRAYLPLGAQADSDGEVVTVTLPGADSATVYRFLHQLSTADLPLVSVTKARPDLEEIFIRLIQPDGTPTAGVRTGAA
ncbi:MAG TPA: ABC transporter ATP-binding protein [Pseudonocardiaceae bacterium]|nr:ABC transporter ATP-binding protein [Pseudonocardiaceae bacterium]